MANFSNINEYISTFPPEIQNLLESFRNTIRQEAPDAEETISYGMPAFKQNGILVWFAANKTHIGFYPSSSPIIIFKGELAAFKTSKGAIQFPFDQLIPTDLVQKIVRYRVRENQVNADEKAIKKKNSKQIRQ